MLHKKLSILLLPVAATLTLHANDPLGDAFFKDPFGDDIFKEMMQMQQNMDKMFERMHQRMQQRSSRLVSPAATYKIAQPSQFVDKGKHYEFETDIPENRENQIDISANNGVLSISAKIIEKYENKTANSYSNSSSMRMYQQRIPLPKDANEGSLKADYKNAKLVISIEKKKANEKRVPNININTPKSKPSMESNKTKETNSSKKKITINSDIPTMS